VRTRWGGPSFRNHSAKVPKSSIGDRPGWHGWYGVRERTVKRGQPVAKARFQILTCLTTCLLAVRRDLNAGSGTHADNDPTYEERAKVGGRPQDMGY